MGDGPILSMPLDCLLWHVPVDLERVDFVKIDVEGFEIAALQGAQKSLFRKPGSVGALLMEVGPARWQRSSISLPTGVSELKRLGGLFKISHILLRDGRSSCRRSVLAPLFATKTVTKVEDNFMYEVAEKDWEPLITKMAENNIDCNFWFTNDESVQHSY